MASQNWHFLLCLAQRIYVCANSSEQSIGGEARRGIKASAPNSGLLPFRPARSPAASPARTVKSRPVHPYRRENGIATDAPSATAPPARRWQQSSRSAPRGARRDAGLLFGLHRSRRRCPRRATAAAVWAWPARREATLTAATAGGLAGQPPRGVLLIAFFAATVRIFSHLCAATDPRACIPPRLVRVLSRAAAGEERAGPRHARRGRSQTRPPRGCAWLWSRGAWLVLPAWLRRCRVRSAPRLSRRPPDARPQ